MQQSLTAYKLIENLPKTSFIAKDRVLSINFIDSGNQFAQLICEREKIPVKSKNQNDERNTGQTAAITISPHRYRGGITITCPLI
jgi:hypothetical protein